MCHPERLPKAGTKDPYDFFFVPNSGLEHKCSYMTITKKILAEKIKEYLYHKITLADLVNWAESIMMEGDFTAKDELVLKNIVSLLGVADVRSFGLTLEDCESFLEQLGYKSNLK